MRFWVCTRRRYHLNLGLLTKSKRMNEIWRIVVINEKPHVENIAASWIPAYNNSVIIKAIMISDPSKD